jgi:peptidoglycan/LPS O-acetylase OafA/YrhL
MAKECPVCRLINPDIAQRCDCGYDFASKRIAPSYARPNDPEVAAERGMTVADVGVRNLKKAAPRLIAATILLVVGVAVAASDPKSWHAAAYGLAGVLSAGGLMAQAIGQYRRGRKISKT